MTKFLLNLYTFLFNFRQLFFRVKISTPILIAGKSKSGKDTLYKIFQKFSNDYDRVVPIQLSFADEVKKIACKKYSLDYSLMSNSIEYKDNHRQKLIDIGMNYRKERIENIWIFYLMKNLLSLMIKLSFKKEKVIYIPIITDGRFVNESDYIHNKLHGHVIFIERLDNNISNLHVDYKGSESQVEEIMKRSYSRFTYILNDGTSLQYLEDFSKPFLTSLLRRVNEI